MRHTSLRLAFWTGTGLGIAALVAGVLAVSTRPPGWPVYLALLLVPAVLWVAIGRLARKSVRALTGRALRLVLRSLLLPLPLILLAGIVEPALSLSGAALVAAGFALLVLGLTPFIAWAHLFAHDERARRWFYNQPW